MDVPGPATPGLRQSDANAVTVPLGGAAADRVMPNDPVRQRDLEMRPRLERRQRLALRVAQIHDDDAFGRSLDTEHLELHHHRLKHGGGWSCAAPLAGPAVPGPPP